MLVPTSECTNMYRRTTYALDCYAPVSWKSQNAGMGELDATTRLFSL